jgi:hypothetical protein
VTRLRASRAGAIALGLMLALVAWLAISVAAYFVVHSLL